jgi:protein subunit release factor A
LVFDSTAPKNVLSQQIVNKPSSVVLFPNPNSSRLVQIHNEGQSIKEFQVISAKGEMVEAKLNETKSAFDVSNLPSGIYGVILKSHDGKSSFHKLILQ